MQKDTYTNSACIKILHVLWSIQKIHPYISAGECMCHNTTTPFIAPSTRCVCPPVTGTPKCCTPLSLMPHHPNYYWFCLPRQEKFMKTEWHKDMQPTEISIFFVILSEQKYQHLSSDDDMNLGTEIIAVPKYFSAHRYCSFYKAQLGHKN